MTAKSTVSTMKTRKRSRSTAQSAAPVPSYDRHGARTKLARLPELSCSQLRQQGFTTLGLTNDTATALTIAAAALQGQLKLCNKQPEHHRTAGYQAFPRKQTLAYQAGVALSPIVPILQHVAIEEFAQLAQQLEMPPDVLLSIFDKAPVLTDGVAATSLDTIHYLAPNMTAPVVDANASANCEAHVDKGLLTFIFPDTEQGLEVMTADGSWQELQISEGHIAVLAGYTLERATCGLVKAVTHTVVVGNGGCVTARQALAYKLRATDTAVIDTYSAAARSHTDISPRFEKSIGVRELMHFFEVTHRSINALPSAPEAATSTKPLQLTAIPLISQAERHSTFHIRVRGQDGSELQFKVRGGTVLYAVFNAYTERKGLEMDDVRFMYEGSWVTDPRSTCGDYEMESGDIIEAMVHQVGD